MLNELEKNGVDFRFVRFFFLCRVRQPEERSNAFRVMNSESQKKKYCKNVFICKTAAFIYNSWSKMLTFFFSHIIASLVQFTPEWTTSLRRFIRPDQTHIYRIICKFFSTQILVHRLCRLIPYVTLAYCCRSFLRFSQTDFPSLSKWYFRFRSVLWWRWCALCRCSFRLVLFVIRSFSAIDKMSSQRMTSEFTENAQLTKSLWASRPKSGSHKITFEFCSFFVAVFLALNQSKVRKRIVHDFRSLVSSCLFVRFFFFFAFLLLLLALPSLPVALQ